MNPAPFFRFAEKRHRIYINREQGFPSPWTDDPVLHQYRFTNVYRELDAVTVWFRENVRGPMRDDLSVLLATVLFRWFNRIPTGEAIFLQKTLGGETPWEILLENGPVSFKVVSDAIRSYCGKGPYVTGAYIITSPQGYNKVDGVLKCIDWFMTQEHEISGKKNEGVLGFREAAKFMRDDNVSLEQAWEWLRKFHFMGDFMAYEVVTDLRHTSLLDKAPDIMTWANPGPGAMRGLNRLHGRPLNKNQPKHVFNCEMRDLLEKSLKFWPKEWPPMEMREIEHTLCEFDKYERARLGQGKPRGVYPHGKT